eukprot:4986629-Amphidinium_carterae.1
MHLIQLQARWASSVIERYVAEVPLEHLASTFNWLYSAKAGVSAAAACLQSVAVQDLYNNTLSPEVEPPRRQEDEFKAMATRILGIERMLK